MNKILIPLLLVTVLSFKEYPQDTGSVISSSLDTIYVTTGKYEMNINDLPYSAAAVTVEKISRSTLQSVPELLQRQSGLSLIRDGIWGTEISIRGLNRSNVVVLIEGSRVETSTDVSARLSMIDINDIERIEVIKGAASSLYGTGASGGVVNIISRKPQYNDAFYLRGSVSSGYNSVNTNFNESVNLLAGDEWWTAKFSAAYRKAENIKTPSGVLPNSQYNDNSFNGLLTFRPFQNHEIEFNAQQFNAHDVGIPGGEPLFPDNASVRYPLERRRLFSADYKITALTEIITKVSARYYYQDIDRDVENIPNQVQIVNTPNGRQRVSVLKILPQAMHITNGFQLQGDFVLDNSHYIIAGIDHWKRRYNGIRSREQKIESLAANDSVLRTNYRTIFEKPLPDASFSSTGLYAQDEFRLVKNALSIIAGVRYDFINIENNEVVNPLYEILNGNYNYNPANQTVIWEKGSAKNNSYSISAGAVYRVGQQGSITFNIAQSFRSPSLEERYQYIDLGSVVRVGDPELKPEKGYFIDLGGSYSNNIIKTKAGVFYNSLRDLVAEVPGTFEGRNALVKTNIGKAELYGLELEADYDIANSFTTYTSASFVRGKNIGDKANLPQIAPFNGTTGFRCRIFNGFEADLAAVYFGPQNNTAPGEIHSPGYVYFNLNAGYTAIRIGQSVINLYAGVENILDREYRNHLSTTRGAIVSEPGRNYYVKFTASL